MNTLQKPATPLLNFFDLDPERLKPLLYKVDIDVPVLVNGIGHGSITTRNQPFIWTKTTHRIIGNTFDPESSGLYDDGQYDVEMSDEMRVYTVGGINADLLFGPKGEGEFQEMAYPVYFAGTHTVLFRLTNLYTRVLTPRADTFRVQFCIHGLADWGKLTQEG